MSDFEISNMLQDRRCRYARRYPIILQIVKRLTEELGEAPKRKQVKDEITKIDDKSKRADDRKERSGDGFYMKHLCSVGLMDNSDELLWQLTKEGGALSVEALDDEKCSEILKLWKVMRISTSGIYNPIIKFLKDLDLKGAKQDEIIKHVFTDLNLNDDNFDFGHKLNSISSEFRGDSKFRYLVIEACKELSKEERGLIEKEGEVWRLIEKGMQEGIDALSKSSSERPKEAPKSIPDARAQQQFRAQFNSAAALVRYEYSQGIRQSKLMIERLKILGVNELLPHSVRSLVSRCDTHGTGYIPEAKPYEDFLNQSNAVADTPAPDAREDIKSPLLQNAVESIQLGLKDFDSEDKRRVISAVRNLYAGVLLLCKEALRALSPPDSKEILIKETIKAVKGSDGRVWMEGDGKKTIGRHKIEKRFKDLQLKADLSKLARLAEIRNEIEHMHLLPTSTRVLIKEAIADAMLIIHAVIVVELKKDPIDLLGADTWNRLLEEGDVFKVEESACKDSLESIRQNSDALKGAIGELRCPNCSSSLLKNKFTDAYLVQELDLVCVECGEVVDAEGVFEKALEQFFEDMAYIAGKDGEDPPVEMCLECCRYMYINDGTYIDNENKCVNCDFSLKGCNCVGCGQPLRVGDCSPDYSGYCGGCGYCRWKLEKD